MKTCPCGSGRDYSACCGLYISGKAKAPTAEALMRSRYTAYVEHAIDYIVNTCVQREDDGIDYKSTREWSEQSKWLGLKIIKVSKGGIEDKKGTVEFEATYEKNGLRDIHHETAKFKKDKEEWLYVEGEITPQTMVRTTPKTGRNDPCTCGSGKKFKHCCGR